MRPLSVETILRHVLPSPTAVGLVAALIALVAAPTVSAQDLEPRAYVAAPVGLNFLLTGYSHSTGGVVVDPSLPVEDVEATVNSLVLGYGRTFSLAGRTALVTAALPYAWAEASGRIGETSRSTTRSGLPDSRFKLSVNLLGGRALTPREFAGAQRSTIVGVSLLVAPPLGQYYPSKLVNLGSNRWSYKPEVGVSHLIGRRWTLDAYAAAILFSDNDRFYTGSSLREQNPIFALQGHASYTVRPRAWVAFDATFYRGGTTTIDHVVKADLQKNSRVGATLSLPVKQRSSLKLAYSAGATTRIGGDFRTFSVAWQYQWFDRPR